MFGFPVDNSRPLHTVGNNTTYFLGCASFHANYSSEANMKHWQRPKSGASPEKDFLFEYLPPESTIEPHGFSGSGVWIPTADRNRLVWNPDPILVGTAHKYFKQSHVIAAAKVPTILEFLNRR
jgi:hypothetical protein